MGSNIPNYYFAFNVLLFKTTILSNMKFSGLISSLCTDVRNFQFFSDQLFQTILFCEINMEECQKYSFTSLYEMYVYIR